MRFAKPAEQNFSPEIFRVVKVIERRPRAVYELEELNGTRIDGQFYREEDTPARITDRTVYKINKIPDKRVRSGIREYLAGWRGYSQDFESWVPAAGVKNTLMRRLRAIFTSFCSATPHATSTNRIFTPISR